MVIEKEGDKVYVRRMLDKKRQGLSSGLSDLELEVILEVVGCYCMVECSMLDVVGWEVRGNS